METIKQKIINASKEMGFSQIGFTDTALDQYHNQFIKYLQKKRHGKMHYMQRNIKKRLVPQHLIPYVKTIISVSMDYLPESISQSQQLLNQPHKAYISRYALGKDYHKIMRKRMKQLSEKIAQLLAPHQYRVFSDSAPVLEKPLAQKAGLGWIGKHTNLISHRHGSYFFLGEIMTDLALPKSTPQTDHCANCNLCISACPTKAIVAPYQLDASLCISYLTIELKDEIPKPLRPLIGNRIYGCDDCQIVCPWNKFAQLAKETKFHAKHQLDNQTLIDLFQWDEPTFKSKTQGSPIRRIGYDRWIRNIAVALGNAPKNSATMVALQTKINFPNPVVQEHILWAIEQQKMKRSQFFIPTLKEDPKEAELPSHKLMVRAGLIQQLSTGLYTYLPLGLLVIKKIEKIIRKNLNKAGAIEMRMPIVQPSTLWEQTGRWDAYGKELLKFRDRHDRPMCLGATHEEVITHTMNAYVKSYKHLPINLYQINTKFRDEIRPRFGLMRAREFIMKDGYSFHADKKSLASTYQTMKNSYTNIFKELGLQCRAVDADSGNIGGDISCEFHALANNGEDLLAINPQGQYAANIETAQLSAQQTTNAPPENERKKIHTPNIKTIEQLCQFLKITPKQCIKTIILKDEKNNLYAFALRADHTLNLIKATKIIGAQAPLQLTTPKQLQKTLGCEAGFMGVVNLKLPLFVDYSALAITHFICGANENNYHFEHAHWARDVVSFKAADLRYIEQNDPVINETGHIEIKRGIEIGHIFQLGIQYTQAMGMKYLDQNSKSQSVYMGCYGIGVSRLIAAVVEQHHDNRGIIWPDSISPFDIHLMGINAHKSPRLQQALEHIYHTLNNAGFNVLWDDLPNRAGFAFADADLIGIPHRLIISESNLDASVIEYQHRKQPKGDTPPALLPLENLVEAFKQAQRSP